MTFDIEAEVLAELTEVTGPQGVVTDPVALEPHVVEWRGLYRGFTPVMLAPQSTQEAAGLMRICHKHGIGIVPQGGNTGLVGGAIPGLVPGRKELLLSASRMRQVREIDAGNYTITAEAGCILADVQAAAEEADRLFPLSLAAEGSCQLGGNLSTNAGGTNVLRYGNTRDLVLGLEVVLADGRIFDGLRGLRKDNTGYDLKHLFIGAEGTLGFITAATCKLFPRPRSLATAFVAVTSPTEAIHLYGEARVALGDQLVAFELINRMAVDLVVAGIPGVRDPLDERPDWYILLELGSADKGAAADDAMERFLATQLEAGMLSNGVLARSSAQREDFWRLRHNISEAQKVAGAGIKHDISVPVSRIDEFLEIAGRKVEEHIPGVHIVAFGHLGDGNLHFNLNQPQGMTAETFLDFWDAVSQEVHVDLR